MDRIAPKQWVTINGTSVTHSCSPSLHAYTDSVPVQGSMRVLPLRHEESQFIAQGDYWIIGYQKHIAFLKASRGFHYLGQLLRNPGREFHVSELIGQAMERRLPLTGGRHDTGVLQNGLMSDAGPILDVQAKAEYKRRLNDLGRDLAEAQRFDDLARIERAREEMEVLGEQLMSAIGLGGRNRKLGSQAERARSAVTKQIKSSIKRIGVAIPALGRHLGNHVRTGYFCSYKPSPERQVTWKV